MTEAPAASIVIPHYGDRSLTWTCFEAIRSCTHLTYELIVVDNGTGHELPGKVIRNSDNLGFAVASNQGARAARAPVLVFLNNDTEPRSGWLPRLIDAIHEQGAGAASPRIVNSDGTLQYAGVEVVRHRNGQTEVLPCTRDREPGPVRLATAACLVVRRVAFDAVGGFDEAYYNGLEDVDLCLSLGRAGWSIVYVPGSEVLHHGSAGGAERWRSVQENVARLSAKWGELTPDRRTSWSFLVVSWLRHRAFTRADRAGKVR